MLLKSIINQKFARGLILWHEKWYNSFFLIWCTERDVDDEDGSEDVGYGTYDMEEDEEESSKASAAKEVSIYVG